MYEKWDNGSRTTSHNFVYQKKCNYGMELRWGNNKLVTAMYKGMDHN
jgi:hypothetical protein